MVKDEGFEGFPDPDWPAASPAKGLGNAHIKSGLLPDINGSPDSGLICPMSDQLYDPFETYQAYSIDEGQYKQEEDEWNYHCHHGHILLFPIMY